VVIYSKVTEAPDSEPVTLEEAKVQLHIEDDYTDEDALITSLIKTARRMSESYAGLSFLTQEREMKLDRFPCNGDYYYNRRRRSDGIIVPYGPIQSIDAVKYIDGDGVEQTMDPADYKTDLHSDLARIFPTDSWPSIADEPNAVTVQYTAGYDSVSGLNFPEEARQAILMQVTTLYQNRQDEVLGTSTNMLCWGSRKLLDPIKVYWNAEQD